MILPVKFKTPPGEQFVVRREVYQRIQERFREEGIEFAHRNVTVYLPPEVTGATSIDGPGTSPGSAGALKQKLAEAGAAAAIAASRMDEDPQKPKR